MDSAKVKVKTARITSEMSGPLDAVITDLLCYVSTPERRLKVLADMQEIHARMVEFESAKAGAA